MVCARCDGDRQFGYDTSLLACMIAFVFVREAQIWLPTVRKVKIEAL
jgi:hypothetical protein